MRRILWLVLLGAILLFGCAPPPTPFKPAAADLKQLMNEVVDPAADFLWDSVGTTLTLDPSSKTPKVLVEEKAPKTNEEWAKVRHNAMVVAESGNLMMMAPRAKDNDAWMKLSQALVDAGTAEFKAAENKNVDQLFTVGGDIYAACSACHQQYMDAIRLANK